MSKELTTIKLDAEQTKVFNKVHKEIKPQVMNYLRTKIRNAEEREELCNEIFIKFAYNINSYDSKKNVKFNTWFFTIVNNAITDYYRTIGRKSEFYITTSDFVNANGDDCFTFTDNTISCSAIVENKELRHKIRQAIRCLKPQEKRIAILRLVKEYEYQEISEILDIPLNSVKVMIMRTKESLQNVLANEYASL